MNTSLNPLILLAACIALGRGVSGITCEPGFFARRFVGGWALHCHYRCAWSIRNYGKEDNGTPCIIKMNRFGVCYQGYCVDRLPPPPAIPVPKEAPTGIPITAGTASRTSVVSSMTTTQRTRSTATAGNKYTTTRIPVVSQRSEFTSTEREKITATRQSASSSTATPGNQTSTIRTPAVSQHSLFTPTGRQWVTGSKQYTSTTLPTKEATSETQFTSTRAPGFQPTTKETIPRATKRTTNVSDNGNSDKQKLSTIYGVRPTRKQVQTTTSRQNMYTTTRIPEVSQHPELTSTEREKVTATRLSASSSIATPGNQTSTIRTPAVSQHSLFTPTGRQWVTGSKQYTSTTSPTKEATSETQFTSTRAPGFQPTTKETITRATKRATNFSDNGNSDKQKLSTIYGVRPTRKQVQATTPRQNMYSTTRIPEVSQHHELTPTEREKVTAMRQSASSSTATPGNQTSTIRTPADSQLSLFTPTGRQWVTGSKQYTSTTLPTKEATSETQFTSTRAPGFQPTTKKTITRATKRTTNFSDNGNSDKQKLSTIYGFRPTRKQVQTTTPRQNMYSTTRVPEVSQHQELTPTERETVTATRQSASSSTATPGNQTSTIRTPADSQLSLFTPTGRQWVTGSKQYTSTTLPTKEATSETHFTSTRAPGFQPTTKKTITRATKRTTNFSDNGNSDKQKLSTIYGVRPTRKQVQTTTPRQNMYSTTRIPEVSQHQELTPTEREKVTATRQSASISTATPGIQFSTATTPVGTQQPEFTSSRRQWVTARKQYTSTRFPKEKAMSETQFRSTRADVLQTTTQEAITRDTDSTANYYDHGNSDKFSTIYGVRSTRKQVQTTTERSEKSTKPYTGKDYRDFDF
ncbi:mucin-5AC-like [Ornithodoros turicata]|uniref:mucin-5AC-like n=1 Tax=Ornithodoros turicata TaxID=34597 RepID=UPI0031391E12